MWCVQWCGIGDVKLAENLWGPEANISQPKACSTTSFGLARAWTSLCSASRLPAAPMSWLCLAVLPLASTEVSSTRSRTLPLSHSASINLDSGLAPVRAAAGALSSARTHYARAPSPAAHPHVALLANGDRSTRPSARTTHHALYYFTFLSPSPRVSRSLSSQLPHKLTTRRLQPPSPTS